MFRFGVKDRCCIGIWQVRDVMVKNQKDKNIQNDVDTRSIYSVDKDCTCMERNRCRLLSIVIVVIVVSVVIPMITSNSNSTTEVRVIVVKLHIIIVVITVIASKNNNSTKRNNSNSSNSSNRSTVVLGFLLYESCIARLERMLERFRLVVPILLIGRFRV